MGVAWFNFRSDECRDARKDGGVRSAHAGNRMWLENSHSSRPSVADGDAAIEAYCEDYAGLVSRSELFELEGHRVRVASLPDIIRSKEAAGRPKDHATLPILYALQEEIARLADRQDR